MHLVGKGEIVQKAQIPTTTTAEPIIEDPRLALKENETLWTPEAMTIPPETSTTTTETLTTTTTEALTTIAIEALTTTTETTSEVLHMLAFKTPRKLENGTLVDVYEPVSLPEFIFKIPLTTEKSSKENEIE